MPPTEPIQTVAMADNTSTVLTMDGGMLPSLPQRDAPGQESVPPEARGTVLLVEDDDSLREMTTILLTAMGYRVVPCSDAQVAFHEFLFGDAAGSIDLLLTDIEMPGRSGVELARELTLLRPSLPVMIVSGSLISGALGRELQDRQWRFLSKPFLLPALLDTVRELLPAARETAA